MSDKHSRGADALAHLVHSYFIWIVIGSYVVAALAPQLGIGLQKTRLLDASLADWRVTASPTTVMLALLLFNAGLTTNSGEIRSLARKPVVVAAGALGNFLVPLTFILGASFLLAFWHNSDETQQILTGLAFIAAMPIAGASTAWAQSVNGNMSLSIGLVLATTALSPLLTPFVLHSVAGLTTGDYSEDLHELASGDSMSFLGAWVLFPSLLGIFAGRMASAAAVGRVKPFLKLSNYATVVLLNYANASLSLPEVVKNPDIDFLAVLALVIVTLCACAFAAGWLCARASRADRGETASLTFALGMNNNGAGLSLASIAMPDHSGVLLAVILYNLTQHFMAALVDRLAFRERA
ncbi:MAG: Na+-dependent transporter [Methylocystis sp.]|nr:MAG: Na+-dependent transporter [Methylocystis sp.]